LYPRPPNESVDPADPHERERKALNEIIPTFPSMSPTDQRRLDERLALWGWHERERHPLPPVLSADLGDGIPYDEFVQQEEAEKAAYLQIGSNIADNPFAGGFSLDALQQTGDVEQAAQAGESFLFIGALEGMMSQRNAAAAGPRLETRSPPRKSAPRTTARRSKNAPNTTARKNAPRTSSKGRVVTKPPPLKAAPSPVKLSPRQQKLKDTVRAYRKALPKIKGDKYITVAILVTEKDGSRETWIATNTEYTPREIVQSLLPGHEPLPGTRGPPGNKERPKELRVSYHHAEQHGVSVLMSNGYKIIEVYPSRPACDQCSGLRDMGITVFDP
jgi:hypothetical protein